MIEFRTYLNSFCSRQINQCGLNQIMEGSTKSIGIISLKVYLIKFVVEIDFIICYYVVQLVKQ